MQKETRTYQELLAEVYEESAPNTLVYSHENLGDDADEYNVDKHEENELEDKEEFNKFQGVRGNPEHVIQSKAKEDNIGKASFNYDKHIRTYAINIDGKFRAYPNIVPLNVFSCSTSNIIDVIPPSDSTHFLFRASRLYKNIFSIKLTSFEFVNCFYTFTAARKNNTFNLSALDYDGSVKTKTIVIPDGNYFIKSGSPSVVDASNIVGATGPAQPVTPENSNDLLLVINALIKKTKNPTGENSYYFGSSIDTAFQNIQVEVDSSDGFISFSRNLGITGPAGPFSIDFPKTQDNVYKNGIGYNLGFSQIHYESAININSKFHAKTFSIEGESFPDAVNDTYLYLKLNDWYIIRHQNSDQTEIVAFMKIPLNVPKNTIQYMSNSTNTILNEYFFPQPTNFQTIEIQLVDAFGQIIDLRGANFAMTLQIQEVLQSNIYEKMLELQ